MGRQITIYATVLALLHLVVALLHNRAHAELQIGLPGPLSTLLISVILIGVYLAAALVVAALRWPTLQRSALLLFTVSMAAVFVFAGYYHFLVPGPDHIAHVPEGYWGDLFRGTAVLAALLEALGLILGFVWLRGPTKPFNAVHLGRAG